MMRVLSVGDLHGRSYWKKIDPRPYDKIVFVGDFCDQYPPMTDAQILTNLKDLITFKKAYPDKVELLFGNHDLQYAFQNDGYDCPGYRATMNASLYYLFRSNKDIFKMAFQIGNYLWTHAGVTNGWYNYHKAEIDEIAGKFETKNLADTFNHMMFLKENRILHERSWKGKRGGYRDYGGITWADREETKADYLSGYHQIVGHTPIERITKFGDEKGSIRFIDVLNEVYFVEERNKQLLAEFGEGNFTPVRYDFPMFHELEILDEQY